MSLFPVLLMLATLLCSLVAGLVFAFATVVMPGIRSLGDGEFIRAFQVIDGVIQRGQPLFVAVWLGSAVTLIAATVAGYAGLDQTSRVTMVVVSALYVLGVQLPTVVVNVPLNNGLQSLEVGTMNGEELASARAGFESRWNRSNVFRTVVAIVTTITLIHLAYQA